MKKTIILLLHLVLWAMVFFTFFNIHNALAGFPKAPGYDPFTDISLYAGALVTSIYLIIPFYFGYFITTRFLKSANRKQWIFISLLFMVIYPVLASVWDDGFRYSAILQSVFLFAFLNIFFIMGVGLRSLFILVKRESVPGSIQEWELKVWGLYKIQQPDINLMAIYPCHKNEVVRLFMW